MRRVGLSAAAGLMLLAAFLVSVPAISASVSTPIPSPVRHTAGARSNHPAGIATGPRTPTSVASTPVCDGAFHVVASPNRTGDNILEGNSVIGLNDAWAVGSSNGTTTSSRTLAEHWNGTSWSIKATVNPDTRNNRLLGVSAVSSNDVWAVGYYDINATSLNDSATLAEHWNGTSWSKVATVNPTVGSYFYGVTTIAANDVWAVGQYFNFGSNSWNTLIEHYNGSTWAVVTSANSSTLDYNELDTISAFSSTDIWAVGGHAPVDGSGNLGTFQSLAEHWDGASWTVVSTPNTATGGNAILGVNALEANHAVGVGYGDFVNGSAPQEGEAWDLTLGGSTNVVLNASASDNAFLSVARAADGVWAVGYASTSSLSPLGNLVWQANWNSSTHTLTWAASPGASDSPSSTFEFLTAVAAVSPSVFWAVGTEDTNTFVDQTLTEVYCGLHFMVSAPPTAVPGSAFSVTVTAKNADASTATGYRGTIHFTSSDSQAVLPADYTFTPGDAGVHTFSGLVLRHLSIQSITASDTVTPFVTGSTNVTVACVGVCPSTAGTPGSRAVLPGPPPGLPGARVPTRPRAPAVPRLAAPPQRASSPVRSSTTVDAKRPIERDIVLVSARSVPAPQQTDPITRIESGISLGLLVLAVLALRLRRSGEEAGVDA
ncbi:MAG: hypothetical protein ABI959_09740 [Candidatus Dormiibacterota bacterium]